MKTQMEEGHLQARENGLEQTLPQSPQKRPVLPTRDFCSPEEWDNRLKSLEPPSLCIV